LVCKSFTEHDPCNTGRRYAEQNGYKHSTTFPLSAEIFTNKVKSPNGKNFDGFYEAFELKTGG